jgi:hypothetical protein
MIAAVFALSAPSASTSADTSTDATASSIPPIIEINGENPAHIHVGDTYNDLGATITGPQADLNLGIHTFVGSTPIEQAVIDTSEPATYHLYYVATDQSGNTATSTRTVIIEPVAQSSPPTADTSTTVQATSSAQ